MIIYTLSQNDDDQWSICCMGSALVDGLQLGPAIKQARDAARAEHAGSGLPTCVEMRGAGAVVRLASYQKPENNWLSAAV
jgi:hypothetical protein